MKRAGNLMEAIASMENLHEAFLRAVRGKQGKREVQLFRKRLDQELQALRRELLDGTLRFGHYHFFTIYDPKRRTICAASFRERVAFHAMMRICHPVFDNYQVPDSYASRLGRGTYKALERAQQCCHRYAWFAKLDVCRYFDSIHHDVLLAQLCRLFKDRQLLIYFQDLLATYEVSPRRGLPIGNLTSQYFANHYLSPADHCLTQTLRVPAMVRYMDDVLIFAPTHSELMDYVRAYTGFVGTQLRLELHPPVVNRTRFGVPFLGYVVRGEWLRLNLRSKRRFRDKMGALTQAVEAGEMNEQTFAARATALLSFVTKARSSGFLLQANDKGLYPRGL